ncbi:MAG: class I SAM-dependent methyltransferase [Pseudomonadota bacterium]
MAQSDASNWTEVAEDWIAWVRTEDHDAFWAYRDAFEQFVGHVSGAGLEIGAGEGRICRVLQGLGYNMTALEPVAAFLEAARAENSATSYIQASASKLPLASESFDLVVLYNVLMDVDDLDASVKEAARVLTPEGRMIVGIVHPVFDVFMAAKSGETLSPYFEPHVLDTEVAANGLIMRFRGWMRPLSAYVNACADAGLFVTRMEEPRPDPAHPATLRLTEQNSVPTFLWLELRRLSHSKETQ